MKNLYFSLTQAQAENLTDFLEKYFLYIVRIEEIDDVDYVTNILDTHKKIKEELEIGSEN